MSGPLTRARARLAEVVAAETRLRVVLDAHRAGFLNVPGADARKLKDAHGALTALARKVGKETERLAEHQRSVSA
jgi:hypothetical protein